MKSKILSVVVLLVFSLLRGYAQTFDGSYLKEGRYTQTYEDCHPKSAMFINADQPPEFKGSLQQYFEKKLEGKYQNIEGKILLQILIDSLGDPCCSSIINKTGKDIQDLKLKEIIDGMPKWQNAVNGGYSVAFSAMVELFFHEKKLIVQYSKSVEVLEEASNENLNSSNKPYVFSDTATNSVWKLWTTTNSVIPKNMSREVACDSHGRIWYCTDGGIVRIDGNDWQVFSGRNVSELSGRAGITWTTGLAIDKNDNVWIESFDEIVRFDGEKWTRFDTTNSPLKLVHEISPDRYGNVWFGTFQGLIKYDGKTWTSFTTKNSGIISDDVRQVYVDDSGACWIATGNGICKFNDSKWLSFSNSNSPFPNNDVSTIQGDKNGNIWAGTSGNGKNCLLKLDRYGKWSAYETGVIWKIAVDNTSEHIWIATNGDGLLMFNGEKLHRFDSSNSIVPSNTVSSITIDDNGNKWIATFGGLVFTTMK